MRVCFVTDDWLPMEGGIATVAAALATRAAAEGHDVIVAARARHVRAAPHLPGVTQVGLRGPSFGRWGGVWTALQVRGSFDRVVACSWPVATWLCRRFEVDVLYHGSDLTRPPIDPRGLGRVLRHGRRHWVMSDFLAGLLTDRGMVPSRLPVPVDPDSSRGPRAGWIFVARAVPQKGGDRFIRLAHAAGVQATVVGDGPALKAWRGLAEALGARVIFTGSLPRDRVREEMARHTHCFLLPRAYADGSGAEGLGLTLFEAAAVGTIPVGCATGGVPEGSQIVLSDPEDLQGSLAELEAGDRSDPRTGWRHGTKQAVAALLG